MRKLLEMISLTALGVQVAITALALFGDQKLPGHIPIHFDAAGNPNGWDSPAMLLLLPSIAVVIYLLLTVVTKFPAAFNYPVRVTVANRLRLQGLALDMIAWLKAEILCLFARMQWVTIEVARSPQQSAPPSMMPIALVVVFATVTFYIAAMFRVAKDPAGL